MRNNSLLFSAGLPLALVTFIGCGGSSTSEIISEPPSLSPPTLTNKKTADLIFDGFRKILPKTTSEFDPFINKRPPVQSDFSVLDEISKTIQSNQLVNLTLQYNNDPDFCYSILKSNNISIGECFVFYNLVGSKQPKEIIIREKFNKSMSSNHFSRTKAIYSLIYNQLWNNSREDSIIWDSIINNPFNVAQNSQYTVNFSLQKTVEGNYQLSNIQISGLTLTQDSFLLKKEQMNKSLESLLIQPVLTTLFANFEKSKEIFN